MSVGVQRLRAEPEVIRKGALDKGEDAALVDVALALDMRRRALLGEADARKAERNAASKQIGEAIKGGAAPGAQTSRSYFFACTKPMSRVAIRSTRYARPSRRRRSSCLLYTSDAADE